MLNLISRLPQSSRFNAAVANDPEHVEAILTATGSQPEQDEYAPPLEGWEVMNDQLATLIDLTETQIAVTVKANGGKPGKIKPSARPRTAFNDVRAKMRVEKHRKLVARVKAAKRQVD